MSGYLLRITLRDSAPIPVPAGDWAKHGCCPMTDGGLGAAVGSPKTGSAGKTRLQRHKLRLPGGRRGAVFFLFHVQSPHPTGDATLTHRMPRANCQQPSPLSTRRNRRDNASPSIKTRHPSYCIGPSCGATISPRQPNISLPRNGDGAPAGNLPSPPPCPRHVAAVPVAPDRANGSSAVTRARSSAREPTAPLENTDIALPSSLHPWLGGEGSSDSPAAIAPSIRSRWGSAVALKPQGHGCHVILAHPRCPSRPIPIRVLRRSRPFSPGPTRPNWDTFLERFYLSWQERLLAAWKRQIDRQRWITLPVWPTEVPSLHVDQPNRRTGPLRFRRYLCRGPTRSMVGAGQQVASCICESPAG